MFEDEPEEGRGTVNPDLGATPFRSHDSPTGLAAATPSQGTDSEGSGDPEGTPCGTRVTSHDADSGDSHHRRQSILRSSPLRCRVIFHDAGRAGVNFTREP